MIDKINIMDYNYLLKIILVGDTSVGKTNLQNMFVQGVTLDRPQQTIGVEFNSKIISVNDKLIKLQIWDTAGQERFRAITRAYYRGAQLAMLVYDITKRDTYNSLANWMADIRSLCSPNVVVVLIGNKSDLEEQREVTYTEAQRFAKEHCMLHIETSALKGTNVNDAFIDGIVRATPTSNSTNVTLPPKSDNTYVFKC